MSRKISRILHIPFLYRIAYEESLQMETDGILVTSVPILNTTSLQEIKGLIKYAESKNALLVLMFHSIKQDDQVGIHDIWSFAYSKFEKICSYLKQEEKNNKILIKTTRDAFQILEGERDV